MTPFVFWLAAISAAVVADQPFVEVWSWDCDKGRCEKTVPGEGSARQSLEVCMLLCPPGTLWPLPTGPISIGKDLVPVNRHSVSIQTNEFRSRQLDPETERLVNEAGKLFTEKIFKLVDEEEPGGDGGQSLIVNVILENTTLNSFDIDMDETYRLLVSKTKDGQVNATISAKTLVGGIYGLETLGQLIIYDSVSKSVVMPSSVDISDGPTYPFRGILLDTARNFISVESIKGTLDAMAANKLNTFHWHITDSHSFPFSSESFPKLTQYGAYSPKKVYTKEDIQSIIEYGKVRGIRILPEMDAPAHVGEGWQWAGDATVCFKAEPWTSYCVEPPCGQLNPTSENMYNILEGIYRDMDDSFQSDLFHMGGDEVNINCWNTSKIVVENMAKLGLSRGAEDFHKLWSMFQDRAVGLLEKVSGRKRPIVIWTSSLTDIGHVDKYLDKSKYIIQIWTKGHDPLIRELVDKGYRVIMSNYDALYFDCGFGAWVGTGNNWCSPYIPWQTVYENDPVGLLGKNATHLKHLVLGAEATLWSEQADDASVDSRLWPRGSALGERLWTGRGDWKSAEQRYLHQRQRLVKLNVLPNTVQPEWCYQNPGYCHL